VGKASRQNRAAQLVREQRVKERQRQRRRRLRLIALAGVLLAGLIGVGAWQVAKPTDVATPASATTDGHGLAVGSGPVTVELYFDFLCPACRQFDGASRPILDEYLDQRRITLIYRPISILDRASTTRYSTRAAAAAGCAADAGLLAEFVPAMMAQQPAEGTAGLSNDEIVQIGGDVGLPDSFGRCVRDEDFGEWVVSNTDIAADRGVQGTPTVFVNDTKLDDLSIETLTTAIDIAE
jgi:protein-disulfide isomerase